MNEKNDAKNVKGKANSRQGSKHKDYPSEMAS